MAIQLLPRMVRRLYRRVRQREQLEEAEILSVLAARGLLMSQVLVDVGANHGRFTLPFLRLGWSALVVEPDPENISVLQCVTRGYRDVRLGRAISSRSGSTAHWYRNPRNTGMSSLIPFDDANVEGQPVDAAPLSEVIMAHGIPSIGILNVDAEGSDLDVLMSYDWTGGILPEVVLAVFDERKIAKDGHSHASLCGYLSSVGYSVGVWEWFPVGDYGRRHRWRTWSRAPHTLQHAEAWGNVLGVRSDHPRAREIWNDIGTLMQRFGPQTPEASV